MATKRLFIAIDLSQVEKEALLCISQELRSQFKEGRVNTQDMYHATLHFFEEVPEDRIADIRSAMRRAALSQKAFTLVTGRPGIFGSEDSAVVWVGISEGGQELSALHETLEKHLAKAGFLPENRPFRPHITLGRGIDVRQFNPPIQEDMLPSVNLSAHALTLLESKLRDGRPVYEPIATASLKK